MEPYPCPECSGPLAFQEGNVICSACGWIMQGTPERESRPDPRVFGNLLEVLRGRKKRKLQQEAFSRYLKAIRAAAERQDWLHLVPLAWLVLWETPLFFPGEVASWLRAAEIALDGLDSSSS